MEEMQMSMNEKDAEIIRLTMCLGDERKKSSDIQSQSSSRHENSTPSRNRSHSKIKHNH